jgi:wobble nucleotide-excising tRNase
MKLKKIEKINCGSFNSFHWDSSVPIFHDSVNIILGWNGSGKTIFSRLLNTYEKGSLVKEDNIFGATYSVLFDSVIKKHDDLTGCYNKIRVFNEDYIQNIIAKTHLDYVVALGETEVDFSKKQKELNDAEGELTKMVKCKNEHDDTAKKVSDSIRRLNGIGHIKKDMVVESNGLYNSYSKSSFEKRIEWFDKQVESGKDVDSFIQNEENLQQLLSTLSNLSEKEREYKILKKWNDWSIEKIEKINHYLQFVPNYQISERISKFSGDSSEENWIRDGVDLHNLTSQEDQLNKCLFCDSEILNKAELLKHFSNDIIDLNKVLDALSVSVESGLIEIKTCESFYFTEKTRIDEFLKSIKNKIIDKRKNKTGSIDKVEYLNQFSTEEIFDVNATAWDIEKDYVAREYENYKKQKNSFELYEKQYAEKETGIKLLNTELKELKKTAKNVKIPVDRINSLLRATFPYKKLELDDSGDEVGYALKRNGNECNLSSLSEGERNFIALAYFLISINDEEDNKLDEESIIVIDDPVSSLDSDTLFQVFAILFGEIESNKKRQYFILTHSLDFFGHLIQNFRKANGSLKDDLVNFYQIKLTASGSMIDKLPDSLKKYRSDYQYAISKLNEIKDSQELDDNILAANLLRRVIETFLYFKYGHGDLRSKTDSMYKKYKEIKKNKMDLAKVGELEQEISQNKKSLERFINHGSHEFLGIEKYDISVLQGSKQRIINFFEVIKIIDPDHYKTFVLTEEEN